MVAQTDSDPFLCRCHDNNALRKVQCLNETFSVGFHAEVSVNGSTSLKLVRQILGPDEYLPALQALREADREV